MTMRDGANSAQLGAGALNSIAAYLQTRAARKSMRAQAEFIENVAEQEAQSLIQAGDERLRAYSQRSQELLEEEGLNRFTGAARVREARDIGEAMIAKIQARSAARGIVLSEGAPLELIAQAAFETEKLAANEELQTRLMSANLLTRARQEMQAGQAARYAAQIQARSTILTAKAQGVNIRTQAPGPFDAIMALTKPLAELDADKLKAGTQPVAGAFRRKKPSSQISLLSETPETISEPQIYGNL